MWPPDNNAYLNFKFSMKTYVVGTQKNRLNERVLLQGSYASGKCQGNLNFFKVREFCVVSANNECFLNVREMSGNFKISSLYQMIRNRK